MASEEQEPMSPWWRGFKGEVKKISSNKYDVLGVASKVDDETIKITELPIHKWTQTFKAELENMISGEKNEGYVKVWQKSRLRIDPDRPRSTGLQRASR